MGAAPKALVAGLPNADWPNGDEVVVLLKPPKPVVGAVEPNVGFAPPNILINFYSLLAFIVYYLFFVYFFGAVTEKACSSPLPALSLLKCNNVFPCGSLNFTKVA